MAQKYVAQLQQSYESGTYGIHEYLDLAPSEFDFSEYPTMRGSEFAAEGKYRNALDKSLEYMNVLSLQVRRGLRSMQDIEKERREQREQVRLIAGLENNKPQKGFGDLLNLETFRSGPLRTKQNDDIHATFTSESGKKFMMSMCKGTQWACLEIFSGTHVNFPVSGVYWKDEPLIFKDQGMSGFLLGFNGITSAMHPELVQEFPKELVIDVSGNVRNFSEEPWNKVSD